MPTLNWDVLKEDLSQGFHRTLIAVGVEGSYQTSQVLILVKPAGLNASGLSRTRRQFGSNHASRGKPPSVSRTGQLRHPIVEIRFSIPDQVVDLHVLGPVATKPPAAKASQTHLEVSRNIVFRKK
jgi:hypothetical protein